MKTIIKISIFIIIGLQIAKAQEPITHNLYSTNPYLINPAATGLKGTTNLILDVYNQWTSFSEAPSIYSIEVDRPLKDNMGIGLNLYSDRRSFLNHTIAMVNYAYHVKVNDDLGVSLGLGAGIVNNNIDFTGVYPGDVTDPLYNSKDYNSTHFEASAGLFMKYKSLRLHFAMPQMLEQGKHFQAQYNLFALYDINVSEQLALTPSVLIRAFPNNILQEDINLMGTWSHKYWLQAGYRTDKSLLTSVGLNVNSLAIGYCYQAHMGDVSNFASGSHEIILGFTFPGKNNKPAQVATPEKVTVVSKMIDKEDKTPVAGTILLKKANILKNSCTAGSTGSCIMAVNPGLYDVTVRAKGYVPLKEILDINNVPKGTDYIYNLSLLKLKKGVEINLGGINFETDSDKLKPEALSILDEVAIVLKENPNLLLEVGGHTDNVGDDNHNMDLSDRRAAAVVKYLVSKGALNDQLIPKGYGETKPIVPNDTPENRKQNRRVVFTVLEMNKIDYKATIKEKAPVVEVDKTDVVKDKKAGNPDQINIISNLIDAKYNTSVSGAITIKKNGSEVTSCKTGLNGKCDVLLLPGKYNVEVYAKGYLPFKQTLDLSKVNVGTTYNNEMKLTKIEKGLVLDFGHINFETDKDVLLPESKVVLDEAAAFFKQYPNLVIEVGGHTDNQASASYNLTLSQKRTVSATKYLISKGVNKDQLVAKGYGLTQPIATNDTPEGRRENRRVVFTIIDVK